MSKSDFIPAADNDFLIWTDHFIALLVVKIADYGLLESDGEAVKTAAADFHDQVNRASDAQAAARRATQDKKESRQRLEKIIRGIVRRIKAMPEYTVGQGAHLGIEGSEDTFDLNTAKPDLAGADQTGGVVMLTFGKYTSDGINIYSKREGGTEWVLLARATVSPYVDIRPLLDPNKPELRHYTAVYMHKDQEIGQFSDEVVVNCAP